jgi:hypothetical protein
MDDIYPRLDQRGDREVKELRSASRWRLGASATEPELALRTIASRMVLELRLSR